MRSALIASAAILLLVNTSVPGAQTRQRLNGVISLIEQKQPVFGVYWPANGGGRRGGEPPPARPAADLAKDALGYTRPIFSSAAAWKAASIAGFRRTSSSSRRCSTSAGPSKTPFFGLKHPLVVKTPKIADGSGEGHRQHQP